jgi:hypothetical protein
MIGWTREILFARSMCSSMRWNCASWVSMASPRQRPAGRDIIRRRCSSFISMAISIGSNRAGGWSVKLARNLEVMWLTGRLVPDHKTIADFRKDNGPAILLGWSLYGKLNEVAFRKVVLVLLLVSGLAIVVTGR